MYVVESIVQRLGNTRYLDNGKMDSEMGIDFRVPSCCEIDYSLKKVRKRVDALGRRRGLLVTFSSVALTPIRKCCQVYFEHMMMMKLLSIYQSYNYLNCRRYLTAIPSRIPPLQPRR